MTEDFLLHLKINMPKSNACRTQKDFKILEGFFSS